MTVKTEAEEAEENKAIMSSPLMHISGFLEALTNMDRDGRVVVNKQGKKHRSIIIFLLIFITLDLEFLQSSLFGHIEFSICLAICE